MTAGKDNAALFVDEKMKKFTLLWIRLNDLQAVVEAYDPEVLFRKKTYVAFTACYLMYAVFELLARYVVYFARLLYMGKLFVLVHIVYLRSF